MILEAFWPAILAEAMSFRFSERPNLKNQGEGIKKDFHNWEYSALVECQPSRCKVLGLTSHTSVLIITKDIFIA